MYSRFQLAEKYLHYYLTASSGKGHGIHSPFVFDFVTNVLKSKEPLGRSGEIEKLRGDLLHNETSIEVEDFGAGSAIVKNKSRKIKDIAASSLKTSKYAKLLAKIAKHYNPPIIIELGTSLGITAAYIATSQPTATVYTLEGSESICNIAQTNFDKLGLKNINLVRGDFQTMLPVLLKQVIRVDFAFIDGNHRKVPSITYFNWLLAKSNADSVFVFDDIHWSLEMEEAWQQIKAHPAVTLTIDLFFIGLVFFNKDFKVNQHFVIRF